MDKKFKILTKNLSIITSSFLCVEITPNQGRGLKHAGFPQRDVTCNIHDKAGML